MTRYVALLRGVNVGGINIKMADLKDTIAAIGFTDVTTVLASGNVLFDSDRTDTAAIKADIEAALRERFGYDAWIVLVDQPTLARIVDEFPFDADRDGWHPYVLLSSDPAALTDMFTAADGLALGDEALQPGDGVLYWHVERGQTLQSPFGKLSGKAKYKSTTTNRNLRTLRKLLGP
ncbi:conserved hypothetical protein [Rhodococcus sp. RD6.2]|jgi:uncharacterized protein (DUF1697 family)|uniref:DUF1697 domain-containing protein n=1 Tax=Rhodococcus sp. RD6.2 TaxID=260936 RepID=UPI00063BCA53|nr:DUF1697 domain-containing protein [Rhodococcus sp. RD6.2]CRK51784.1 conserved hypothetical protein [Rhodococcus sp. RD6.2]